MKAITTAELEKLVAKADVQAIEDRKGFVNVTVVINEELTKQLAVEAKDAKDARAQAVEIIVGEPDGIRGFPLKDAK